LDYQLWIPSKLEASRATLEDLFWIPGKPGECGS